MKEAKLVGKIFVKGVINQATEPTTLMWAGAIGLIQGLKYKGNLKRGLISDDIRRFWSIEWRKQR